MNMHFAKTDIPQEVITAFEEGSIVIFTGSGVSIPHPSKLPSFIELVEKLEKDTGKKAKWIDRKTGKLEGNIDAYLGELRAGGINVNERIASILENPKSKPCSLHKNIVKMFKNKHNNLRIVTTNVDKHFTRTVNQVFGKNKTNIYYGPALPLGDDFNGLVYLHGALEKSRDKIIFTDEDMGKAYLVSGWANKFLQDLFKKYTVLFIGYSHDDPIIRYIGRGLSNTKRYALSLEEEKEKWNTLGINAIIYPQISSKNKYNELPNILNEFSKYLNMDILGHEEKIFKNISSFPNEDLSYIDYFESDVFKKYNLTKLFIKYAVFENDETDKKSAWLEWLLKRIAIKNLFFENSLDDSSSCLLHWLLETFIPSHSEELFWAITENNSFLGKAFLDKVTSVISNDKNSLIDYEIKKKWIAILINNIDKIFWLNNLAMLSLTLDKEKYQNEIFLLYKAFIQPYSKFEKGIFMPNTKEKKIDSKIFFRQEEYAFDSLWNNSIKSNLSVQAKPIFGALVDSFVAENKLQKSFNAINDEYTYTRATIEEHEQNTPRGYSNVSSLRIDHLREVLEFLLVDNPQNIAWILSILDDSVPILKRFCYFAVRISTHMLPSDKFQWFLINDKYALYHVEAKHEKYMLIKDIFPMLSDKEKDAFLDYALNNDQEHFKFWENIKDQSKYARKFNLLSYIKNSNNMDYLPLTQQVEQIKNLYPYFSESDYPTLVFYATKTTPEISIEPISTKELLTFSIDKSINYYTNFKKDSGWNHSNKLGLNKVFSQTAKENFDWGKDIFEKLTEKTPEKIELKKLILQTWQEIELDKTKWDKIRLLLSKNHPSLFDEIANTLQKIIEKNTSLIFEDIDDLTINLYNKNISMDSENMLLEKIDNTDQYLLLILNNPFAQLINIQIIHLSRSKNIPVLWGKLKVFFEKCIEKEDHFAKGAILQQLLYLFKIDQNWVEEKVLPLFDWSKKKELAKLSWDIYLVTALPNENIVFLLRSFIRDTLDNLSHLFPQSQKYLSQHMALINVSYNIENFEAYLQKFFQKGNDELFQLFWHTTRNYFETLEPKNQQIIWRNKISQLIQKRIENIPSRLNVKESSEITMLCTQLIPLIDNIIPNYISKINYSKTNYLPIECYRIIIKKKLAYTHPKKILALLLHIIKNKNNISHIHMQEIKEQLLQSNISTKELDKRLLELGYIN